MTDILKTILCIDDEESILEVTKLCLETVGQYTVTACSNGEEGIAKAKEIKPDLIMIDVMMPGIDGPSTLNRLKSMSETTNIPVIFMTARVQGNEIEEYKGMGAIGVIAKPFDPMTLSEEVERMWSGKG